MKVNLIWAQAKNGIIGNHGAMPWHIPEDLANFRQITQNKPVIMGRKTWDSLPVKFKPLPYRRNIILTRSPNWGKELENSNSKIKTARSVETSMKPIIVGREVEEVWVIGGGQIYPQFLKYASRIEVTEIQEDIDGDTKAPELSPEWNEVRRAHNTSTSGIKFDFITYLKVQEAKEQPSLF